MHLRVWLKEEIALESGVDFLHVAKINGLCIDVTVSCLSFGPHAPIETCSARSFIQYFNGWSVLDAVSWTSSSPGDTPRCILAPSFYLHVVLWAVFCRLLIDIGCVHRRSCTCNRTFITISMWIRRTSLPYLRRAHTSSMCSCRFPVPLTIVDLETCSRRRLRWR